MRLYIRLCVSPEQTSLARYLGYLLTEFDQTFTSGGLQGKDESIKFWVHKVKGQGYDGVKYALKYAFQHCSCHILAEA